MTAAWKRQSIHVPGLAHGSNPIPAASRIGPLIATGGIRGVDVISGELSPDLATQVRLMFVNLERILSAAGGSLDSVIKVNVSAQSAEARPLVNAEWLTLFPDPASLPARHFSIQHLSHGMLVQCDALAVVNNAFEEPIDE